MQGGHFCAGSSVANLTALWAARDAKGIRKVVASESAHVSIVKAANILGLELEQIPVDTEQRLDPDALGDLDNACLVLTAGTTSTGSVDPLHLAGSAGWTHIDAAWAGPLRFSEKYAHLLDGIEEADSVAVSAHKWLFQPKESAIVLFRNMEVANAPISFGGGYLAKPNIGVQGSRGAAAIPLLATLMAWGREGVACRIEQTMSIAGEFATKLQENDDLIVWNKPETAINVFRPVSRTVDQFIHRVPDGMFSTCSIADTQWVRSVAANPMASIDLITEAVLEACRS
jgi:glutamate/tyrosine decarboxylase-like PLP-dependent enzyme